MCGLSPIDFLWLQSRFAYLKGFGATHCYAFPLCVGNMFRPLRHAFHRGFRAMSSTTTSRGSWCRTSAITAAGTVGAGAVVGMVWSPINCDATSKKEGQVLLKDGRKIFYQSTGQGIPVFAFHGMGSAHSTWTSEHSEPGIRLIAIDRPGYGLSCPPPAGYSYTQFLGGIYGLKMNWTIILDSRVLDSFSWFLDCFDKCTMINH